MVESSGPIITANSYYSQIGQDIDGEAIGDRSGQSVSLNSDGTIVAIGAHLNDVNGVWSVGHVRVYQYNGSQWVQIGQDIDGEEEVETSGHSISLNSDGTIVAIGAPQNDVYSGHVRVYQYNGSQWVQLGLDIEGEAAFDYSGYSVSLNSDGTIVAIGAYYNDGNGVDSGHTRVYQYIGSQWVQLGQDIDGEAANDSSGFTVSLNSDGTIVAIGAPYNDTNGADSGHVRVYQYNGSQWIQLGLYIYGEAANNYSGHSVSLNGDGTIVAIGAPGYDGNGEWAGHMRVYQYNGSQWVQLGQDIDGEAANDYSGHSVSLNGDGTIMAIGAPGNDGNGGQAGHVRVYQYNGSQWVQIGIDIDGEAADDYSGHSVSLNNDGTIVAIGSRYNDGNGESSGHVRVYKLTN